MNEEWLRTEMLAEGEFTCYGFRYDVDLTDSLLLWLRRLYDGPRAIGFLLERASVDQAIDNIHCLLAIVELILFELELTFESLELSQLHLDFHLKLVVLPALGLDLCSGTAPLRPFLEHVDAHASLHYEYD